MKIRAKIANVPSPNWMMVDRKEDADRVAKRLHFPLIVKPPHGYASVGITRDSRCETLEQLRIQMELEINEFGRALIEEFIEGREFTCLIVENPGDSDNPITFKPIEFIFPAGESFMHYDLKWVDYEKISTVPVNDKSVEKTLRDQTARIFKAMSGNGYARCDYRMNIDGTIYMLEINPNCGIFHEHHEPSSADMALMYDPTYDHHKFLNLIIQLARIRQNPMIAKQEGILSNQKIIKGYSST
jgi:D-alanine-D-alanine ligase